MGSSQLWSMGCSLPIHDLNEDKEHGCQMCRKHNTVRDSYYFDFTQCRMHLNSSSLLLLLSFYHMIEFPNYLKRVKKRQKPPKQNQTKKPKDSNLKGYMPTFFPPRNRLEHIKYGKICHEKE